MKTLILLSLAILFIQMPLAFGGEKGAASQDAQRSDPDEAGYNKKDMVDAKGKPITVINFDDALIEGQAKNPEGFMLQSRTAGSFRSILELRRDFRSYIEEDTVDFIPFVPETRK